MAEVRRFCERSARVRALPPDSVPEMYASQYHWFELYRVMRDAQIASFGDLLRRWPAERAIECEWLADFSRRTTGDWSRATGEDLCRLYAASRVTTLLTLPFQPSANADADFALAITLEEFQAFHRSLGFRVPDAPAFHPFYHEIVGVRQCDDSNAPIEVVSELWPSLMLGNLMFHRGGCVVSGGVSHVVKPIAEGSKLFWAFRRNHRPYEDLSHGWGGNSQWRTALRRDYESADGFHYNVDGDVPLNVRGGTLDGLPVDALRELVRHRCLITSAIDDADLFPYRYRDFEPV